MKPLPLVSDMRDRGGGCVPVRQGVKFDLREREKGFLFIYLF